MDGIGLRAEIEPFDARHHVQPCGTRRRPRGVQFPPMRYHKLDLNLLTALKALLAEKNVTRAGDGVGVARTNCAASE